MSELLDLLDASCNALAFSSEEARDRGQAAMAKALQKMADAVCTMMLDITGIQEM